MRNARRSTGRSLRAAIGPRVAFAVAASVGFVLSGCSGTSAGDNTAQAEVSILETRIELLNLALPTYGGGTFNPDSMAGKNVILWFWGAH